MYRVAKKTTKKTELYCLKCKHCKKPEDVDLNSEIVKERGILVECTAENRCMPMLFNAKYYYYKEYKSANEMTAEEIEEIVINNRIKYEVNQYRESLKHVPAKQRSELVKQFKQKLKEEKYYGKIYR